MPAFDWIWEDTVGLKVNGARVCQTRLAAEKEERKIDKQSQRVPSSSLSCLATDLVFSAGASFHAVFGQEIVLLLVDFYL